MIGERIKKIREQKGYTQEYVADALKISQSAYSDLEKNKTKINLRRLEKIAEVYESDIVELLSKDDAITFNDNQNGGVANNAFVIKHLSDKLIEQFEQRIKEKDELISILRQQSVV